jgi:hypothetical protein
MSNSPSRTPAVNASHSAGVKISGAASGSLLSRIAMTWSLPSLEPGTTATSTHEFPPLAEEIGRTDPALLTAKIDGPRLLLLAGHSWRVTWIDFKRHRCFVERADGGGKARWIFPVPAVHPQHRGTA